MNSGQYKCDACGGVFDKVEDWTEGDAVAEAEEAFPGLMDAPAEERGVVCDDCYKAMMAEPACREGQGAEAVWVTMDIPDQSFEWFPTFKKSLRAALDRWIEDNPAEYAEMVAEAVAKWDAERLSSEPLSKLRTPLQAVEDDQC